MEIPDVSLELARSIAAQMEKAGHPLLLIGATALAAHGYPRNTEDIDFAVAIPPRELKVLASSFSGSGRSVEYEGPRSTGSSHLSGVPDSAESPVRES